MGDREKRSGQGLGVARREEQDFVVGEVLPQRGEPGDGDGNAELDVLEELG